MSLALATSKKERFGTLPQLIALRSETDQKLREVAKEMEDNRRNMASLDKFIRHKLGLPSGKSKNFIAIILGKIIPRWLQEKMPGESLRYMTEESTTLELIHTRYRKNVDDVQATTLKKAEITKAIQKAIVRFKQDIQTAREQNWDARKLHEYAVSQAGIEVKKGIADLLDDKFNILPPELREQKRQQLLAGLEDFVSALDAVAELNVSGCYACLEHFEKLTLEFGRFIHIVRPIAALRDSARALTEGDAIIHKSREAIEATVKASIRAIDSSLDQLRVMRDYSLASADMIGILQAGNETISDKLKIIYTEDMEIAKVEVKIDRIPQSQITEKSVVDTDREPASATVR